jgi:hypothetical protein
MLWRRAGLSVGSDCSAGKRVRDDTVSAQMHPIAEPRLVNAGDQAALICNAHGQKVTGFYGSNIPKSGWSDLSDKASEEAFVVGGRADPALFTK